MAQIFLFRHGETADNKTKIFSGWRDVDLDQDGIQEAEKIAEKLRAEKVTKAYCSDLLRSQHTLAIVMQPHAEIPATVDARIKERNYGELTGTSKSELAEKDPVNFKLWHRSYEVAPPGGESIKDVEARVMPFIEELMQNLQSEDVVFISAHGNSLRPMRKFFEHMTTEEMCTYEYHPAEVFSYTV